MKRYPLQKQTATQNSRDLHLAFDVGHSSIGWAVLQASGNNHPNLLGCGAVIFQADDCLASQRRGFRRQRRHIRATRQRIARIKTLLAHLGVLTPSQLDKVSTSSPWFHAARVLASDGKEKLTWSQLWDVLRWYAHNRGYDGNRAWSRHDQDAAAEKDDTKKVKTAHNLLADFEKRHNRSGTMAEVWCDLCGLDPLGIKTSTHLPDKTNRPKAQHAAFSRDCVISEVLRILTAQEGHLPGIDKDLISALVSDWRAKPCPDLKLPARYGVLNPDGSLSGGGLLFGQLIPRFDNRIVATCPISFERHYQRLFAETGDEQTAKRQAEKISKVPSANCQEFFQYRWAMQLANVQIVTPSGLRRLTAVERQALHQQIQLRGYFTKGEFKKAVRALTGIPRDNLDQMFVHPDADEALIIDPVQRLLTSKEYAPIFATLPDPILKRYRGQLRRGHFYSLEQLREWLGDDTDTFDAGLTARVDAATTRTSKKRAAITHNDILCAVPRFEILSGRAPHTRVIMAEVTQFALSTDGHPAEESGPLYRSEAIRSAQLQRAIDNQTNNHLVRHRLKILDRLHRDLLAEYEQADGTRVDRITIEVNRDLRTQSGKTRKEQEQDLGLRLSHFSTVVKELEAAFEGKDVRITAGLIRKARIAKDLNRKCPYTGHTFDWIDLYYGKVDKDHIIPRSMRASDSLDSLVITFPEVNRMKGNRTALQFIEEDQGKTVPGLGNLTIKAQSTYTRDVEALETFKGHPDDASRKKNRKRLLLLRDYVEKEFTPRDLTQTSQLVRLGAQTFDAYYEDKENRPVVTSLPGSVTGATRLAWNLVGCLETANPAVRDAETGELHTKTDIRKISHLHHALDACVLAFASLFLPNKGRDGESWRLLTKRRLNATERVRAKELFGSQIKVTKEGEPRLSTLPPKFADQIRKRLAECRVVQHIPHQVSGMPAELNAWRVTSVENGEAILHQRIRQQDGSRPLKERREKTRRLVGLAPGKLQKLKAALVIADNYGLALDPEPTIIPFHKVRSQIHALRKQNGGTPPRILRNGMLLRIRDPHPGGQHVLRNGLWRIYTVQGSLKIDLVRPDVIGRPKTGPVWREVSIKTLLKLDFEILSGSLCGGCSNT